MLLVVAGCVVAGVGDLSFDLLGYLFAFASCMTQAAYLLLVEFQVGAVQRRRYACGTGCVQPCAAARRGCDHPQCMCPILTHFRTTPDAVLHPSLPRGIRAWAAAAGPTRLSRDAPAPATLPCPRQGAGGVSTSELLYYNAITSLPFLAGLVLVTGEAAAAAPQYHAAVSEHGAPGVWSALLSCALMGCLLNYALFLCTVNNSALTTTIVSGRVGGGGVVGAGGAARRGEAGPGRQLPAHRNRSAGKCDGARGGDWVHLPCIARLLCPAGRPSTRRPVTSAPKTVCLQSCITSHHTP